MKKLFLLLLILSSTGVILIISCKKEYSCENCRESNKPPISIAGPDQVITLPTDSILLDGSRSSDADGTISEWLWKKISGPASFNIADISVSKTIVKNLIEGVYQFELKVTDSGGLSAKDTIQINVNDPSQPNRPPIANAGPDQTFTLPTNTINLDGSGSADPDNNITSYSWAKISGPSSFIIDNSNAVQTQITNLVQGTYQFELKVTDGGGLFSKDTMQVLVKDPPPINCDISNRPVGNASFTLFTQLPDPRYGIVVTAAGNKIFIAGGYTNLSGAQPGNFSNRVDIYDLTTGQWSSTQLSEPRVIGGIAVLGNKIFFAGGWIMTGWNSYSSATVDIYDASANTWSIAQLSEPRGDISCGTVDNKVIFAGGKTTNAVDIYDAGTNSWSAASLSEARFWITATTVGHKIFFTGGNCSTLQDCATNKIDIYDAAINTWSYEDYMPLTAGWYLYAGIAVGNKNYWVIGDYWDGGNIVEIQDEVTHTISSECLSGIPWVNPVQYGNKLIFPVSPPLTYKLTHFDVYDLTTNMWSIQKLPTPEVDYPKFVTVNNEVYAIGGYQVTGFLYDRVYKLEF